MSQQEYSLESARRWSPVDRRLHSIPMKENTAIAWLTAVIVISFDAEALSLIPLFSRLMSEYNMGASEMAMALAIVGIVSAATVCPICRFGDMFGMRKVLLLCLLAVVIGNILCLTAPNGFVFIAGRAIVGLCPTTALVVAILRARSNTEGELSRLYAVVTASIGIGTGVAFMISGLTIHWGGTARQAIGILTVLSIIAYALAYLYLPDTRTRTKVKIDYVGAILLAVGLFLLVYTLGEANKHGWTSPYVFMRVGLGLVLLALWIVWELTVAEPMIDLRKIVRRTVLPAMFVSGSAGVIGSSVCLGFSNFVQGPTDLGYPFGGDVLFASWLLLPIGMIIGFSSSFAGPVIDRVGPRNAIIIGGMLIIVGFCWFSFNYDQLWNYFVIIPLVAVGYSFAFTGSNAACMRSARPGEEGMLTGAWRVVAAGVGAFVPVIVTALTNRSLIDGTSLPHAVNFGLVWFFIAGVALAFTLVALMIRETTLDQKIADNTIVIKSADANDLISTNTQISMPSSGIDPDAAGARK